MAKVDLTIDGRTVPLNEFTQEIIGNVSAAMAESLRGVGQDWKIIEFKIQK